MLYRSRGELSYLVPLGSENISAPYFKQCFFQGGGGITPQTVKHHASQSQDRNNKYFILHRVTQEERAKLREGVPYVKIYRYNPKHLYPKLNGYGDNGQRSLKV